MVHCKKDNKGVIMENKIKVLKRIHLAASELYLLNRDEELKEALRLLTLEIKELTKKCA
jgi:hypothetical protein